MNHDWKQRAEMYEDIAKLQQAEIQRLRQVILVEADKWAKHHHDPAKQKYWETFALKAYPNLG